MLLPRVLCLLWLVFLGFAIWGKASRSTQPPIYDAIQYYRKGQVFWETVSQGRLFNPLNVTPTPRGAATVLMSYPFGFNRDPRPYFFRSVYFAVVLTALAAYLVAWPYGQWIALLMAVFMSALPGFYHFEWSSLLGEAGYWGMADAFLAGTAALAVACAVHSVRRDSVAWLGLASILSALCLLTKPIGLLVMALLAATWLLLAAGRGKPDRYVVQGAATMALICAATCIACFSSEYLSAYRFGEHLRDISNRHGLQQGLAAAPWSSLPHLLRAKIHATQGEGLTLAFTLTLLLALRGLRQRPLHLTLGAAAACVILLVGFTFYYHVDGLEQFRYVLVFSLMAATLCLPLTAALVRDLPRPAQAALAVAALVPALGVAVALLQPQPSIGLQYALGIGVSIGHTTQEENAVKTLVHETAPARDVSMLYTLICFLPGAAPFFSADLISQEGGAEPFVAVPDSEMYRPNVVRLQDMLTADYILFPYTESQQMRDFLLRPQSMPTFEQEEVALAAWLSECGPQQGIAPLSTMPTSRLVRVAQPTLFEKSVWEFVGQHRWRPMFYEDNPRHWLTESEARGWPQHTIAASDCTLDDVIHVQAVATERKNNMLRVSILWRQMHSTDRKYTLLLQASNAQNFVVRAFMRMSPAEPPDAAHQIRQETAYLNVPLGVSVTDLMLLPLSGRWTTNLVPDEQKAARLHLR